MGGGARARARAGRRFGPRVRHYRRVAKKSSSGKIAYEAAQASRLCLREIAMPIMQGERPVGTDARRSGSYKHERRVDVRPVYAPSSARRGTTGTVRRPSGKPGFLCMHAAVFHRKTRALSKTPLGPSARTRTRTFLFLLVLCRRGVLPVVASLCCSGLCCSCALPNISVLVTWALALERRCTAVALPCIIVISYIILVRIPGYTVHACRRDEIE